MSKNSQFEKFIGKKKNSVVKEKFKQEKKLAKKQRAEAIDKRFEEKRKLKAAAVAGATAIQKGKAVPSAAKPATSPKSALPEMPLNKYVAHSGICSRRDAAELVKQGEV